MSAEERTAPIRALLAVLGGPPPARMTICGGASLAVDRRGYIAFERQGVVFETPIGDLPESGRGDARVVCDGRVLEGPGKVGHVLYGTCANCAALEVRHRQVLAELGGVGR